MKIKMLVMLISFCLMLNGSGSELNISNKAVNLSSQNDPIESSEESFIDPFDKLSKEEQDEVVNNFLISHNESFALFNLRSLVEPTFSEEELEKREMKIEKLLDQCIQTIGPQKEDSARFKFLELKRGITYLIPVKSMSLEFVDRIQPHYLFGRMNKCIEYLYPSIKYGKYDIENFEYSGEKIYKEPLEKKYEEIYLNVKAAGLLRKLYYSYYPKSMLRAHANETGLTRYIQDEEKKLGKRLNHKQLAITFFGSYKAWIESLNVYFDRKIEEMKIGK